MKKFNDWVRDLPEELQFLLLVIILPFVAASSAFSCFLIASLWHTLYLKWWL